MRVGVACGGTGGHVLPGLAVAGVLARRGHDVTVWLAGKGIEGRAAAQWRGKTVTVRAAGFSGRPVLAWPAAALRLCGAVLSCRRRMAGERPGAMLAMGSYSCVGPALAARSLGVPLVLHEANAVPGRAVTMLAPLAEVVAASFDAVRGLLPGRRIEVTGLPLRTGLDSRFDTGELKEGMFNVLVMGGSQGAHALNTACGEALCRLHSEGVPVQAVHLAGERDAASVRHAYAAAGVPHRVFGFLDDVGKAYSAASAAVARAGAGACAELGACGVPAMLVPLPTSARGHQQANAAVLAAAGGAVLCRQRDLSVERVSEFIRDLWRNPARRDTMANAMKSTARPDAAERVADVLEAAERRHS